VNRPALLDEEFAVALLFQVYSFGHPRSGARGTDMAISKSLRRVLLADNPISRVALAAYRATIPVRHYLPKLSSVPHWLVASRETTNFTYDLTEQNLLYLAETISVVTGTAAAQARNFMREPAEDRNLLNHIVSATHASRRRAISDSTIHFGRRLGWYAFVRAARPKLVIETGIDKGLGSVLLCAALLRNRAEGYEGSYYGTDINPEAGFLVSGKWAEVGKILYGDSIESLRGLSQPIDLFINDSDHSAQYELAEYDTVNDKLTPDAIVLGDNSHCSDALCTFAQKSGRRFLFFAEQPREHWYPGAGIGICFSSNRAQNVARNPSSANQPAVLGEQLDGGFRVDVANTH
jgi:Methyltransferase domain